MYVIKKGHNHNLFSLEETLFNCDWLQHGWRPGVVVGGHYDAVSDLAWEPTHGRYVLSVSSDQTTRLHAPWLSSPSRNQVRRNFLAQAYHNTYTLQYSDQNDVFIKEYIYGSGQ